MNVPRGLCWETCCVSKVRQWGDLLAGTTWGLVPHVPGDHHPGRRAPPPARLPPTAMWRPLPSAPPPGRPPFHTAVPGAAPPPSCPSLPCLHHPGPRRVSSDTPLAVPPAWALPPAVCSSLSRSLGASPSDTLLTTRSPHPRHTLGQPPPLPASPVRLRFLPSFSLGFSGRLACGPLFSGPLLLRGGGRCWPGAGLTGSASQALPGSLYCSVDVPEGDEHCESVENTWGASPVWRERCLPSARGSRSGCWALFPGTWSPP